jgi:hypothetical protein
VLNDTVYRTRAKELSAEMHALPGAERVVDHLASLALERAPAPARSAV